MPSSKPAQMRLCFMDSISIGFEYVRMGLA